MLTRRDFALKWGVYALALLLLHFVYRFTFAHLTLLRVVPFLPPVLLAVVCSFENSLQGVIFSIAFGVLCDLTLPGAFPFVYTLSFFLASLVLYFLAHGVLQSGFFFSLVSVPVTFLILDLFTGAALCFGGRADPAAVLSLFFREALVSLLLLPPCALIFSRLSRRFDA